MGLQHGVVTAGAIVAQSSKEWCVWIKAQWTPYCIIQQCFHVTSPLSHIVLQLIVGTRTGGCNAGSTVCSH